MNSLSECTGTPGLHNDGCECDSYIKCPGCDKRLKRGTTRPERYRKHKDCDFSQTVVREDEQCNPSTPAPSATSPTVSSAKPTKGDAPETAESATSSTDSSPSSPDGGGDASTPADATSALPGVDEYATVLDAMSSEQREKLREQVDAKIKTRFAQPAPQEFFRPTLFSQPLAAETPGPTPSPPTASKFSQPAGRKSELPTVPMSTDGAAIAARLKELFYSYDNRRSSDNRSAQKTMGPSEMGTPCDRRLALSFMRMPPVNPGGDGWAAFVGTSIHAALEQMFLWASGDTGRFAVEQRLEFPSVYVPKGTADLLDRTLLMLIDHKCQGRWSRNKLKSQGPIQTYRVQAHVYAHGARLRGEKVEKVAIVSWPRDESTLDDLYVWVDDYDPAIVRKAFERVEKIGGEVSDRLASIREADPDGNELEQKATLSAKYNVADDCRFCPFYLPNARDITKGCNGKR